MLVARDWGIYLLMPCVSENSFVIYHVSGHCARHFKHLIFPSCWVVYSKDHSLILVDEKVQVQQTRCILRANKCSRARIQKQDDETSQSVLFRNPHSFSLVRNISINISHFIWSHSVRNKITGPKWNHLC